MSAPFIDRVSFALRSGDGGAGAVSFRREKYIPRGGPDGGDGGDGGNVIVRCTPHERTLRKLRRKKRFVAGNGEPGNTRKKHGANGNDLIIELPYDSVLKTSSGTVLATFHREQKEIVLLRGGKGGRGNVHFKSSTRQAPLYAQSGKEGTELQVIAELELHADISFIGAPNAGKSTLLSVLTNAKPKIANYPFTTLIPNIGSVCNSFQERILADIPGILKGAADGYGLGISFLRHIRRSETLAYVLELSPERCAENVPGYNAEKACAAYVKSLCIDYSTLKREVERYDATIAQKPYIIICTKIDTVSENIELILDELKHHMPQVLVPPLAVSAHAQQGMEELSALLFTLSPAMSEVKNEPLPIFSSH